MNTGREYKIGYHCVCFIAIVYNIRQNLQTHFVINILSIAEFRWVMVVKYPVAYTQNMYQCSYKKCESC